MRESGAEFGTHFTLVEQHVISICVSKGGRALSLFDEATRQGVNRDVIFFSSVIRSIINVQAQRTMIACVIDSIFRS